MKGAPLRPPLGGLAAFGQQLRCQSVPRLLQGRSPPLHEGYRPGTSCGARANDHFRVRPSVRTRWALRPHLAGGSRVRRTASPGTRRSAAIHWPPSDVGEASQVEQRETGTFRVKSGLAEMLKGGVIMDVTTADQAKIAEDAGACAVMALERVPADIRKEGRVARMANPAKIREIQEVVTIPVMAKARIGHFAEAQVLQSLEVDYIDESEVLTPAV